MHVQLLNLFHFAANGCGTKTGAWPSLYDGLCTGGGTTIVINSVSDVTIVIANVVRIAMAVAGGLAVIFILLASIYYITSNGDPGRIKQAKDIIINTVIGLVLIIMAYAIISFFVGAL
jgi:hypothetical protein